MQNPKCLMHFGGKVCHFNEVLFEGGGCYANAFIVWLFCLVLSLVVRRDRRVLKLDPQIFPSLSKLVSFSEGVYNPCFGDDCNPLKADQVINISFFLFYFSSIFLRCLWCKF